MIAALYVRTGGPYFGLPNRRYWGLRQVGDKVEADKAHRRGR